MSFKDSDFKPKFDDSASIEHVEDAASSTTADLIANPELLAKAYAEHDGTGLQAVFANKTVFMAAVLAAFGGLTFGYDQGVISVTLVMDHFLQTVPEIAAGHPGAGFNKGLLTAILEFGAMVGACGTGLIADRYSRKRALLIGSIWFFTGSIIQTATYSYPQLVVGRLLGGIGIGLLSCTAPLYISEVSPPSVRGALLVCEELMIVFGVIVAFWLTFGTRHIDSSLPWRLPFGIQIIPALILFLGVFFLPNSPRWLAMRGRDADCLATLARLRNLPEDDYRVQAEYLTILADVRLNQEAAASRHPKLFLGNGLWNSLKLEAAGWGDAFSKRCIKRTHVGLGTTFFQQFIGINALIYYSPTLFGSLGLDTNTSLLMSGIMNTLQLVGCFPTALLLDRVGRRALMLWGSAICLATHTITAILIGVYSQTWATHVASGWAGVGLIFVFMLVFGGTWGPIGWALPAEIFPSSVRAKGVAVSVAGLWFSNFLVGLITPPLNDAAPWGAFAFYAVFTFLSLVWTFFFVPETAGRSLEDMDAVFKDSTAREDNVRRQHILDEMTGKHTPLSSEASM
ncbi:general substrate transporter [Amylostereum chailletii]|nr:general substrate transporter [Amylostereum chailletii]